MLITDKLKKTAIIASLGLVASMLAVTGLASAENMANSTQTTTSRPSVDATSSATQQQHLKNIISKGDQEITRRLATLNKLDSVINSADKLSAADKATLTSQVNDEITNLTNMKSQLDAETTLTGAVADAKSVISDYRVYALIVPKVYLVKTADDQQAIETKLTTLSQKLQTRVSAAQTAGKDVSSMQAKLSDMNSKIAAAQSLSTTIESAVINLQPTDYDSNHSVLSGDRTQLQTARSDLQTAYNDAKSIVNSLENLGT